MWVKNMSSLEEKTSRSFGEFLFNLVRRSSTNLSFLYEHIKHLVPSTNVWHA